MLTADLVDARRKDGALLLRPFDEPARAEALAIATILLEHAKSMVGARRDEVEDAWDASIADAKRPKLAAGLKKLAADACNFEASSELDPIALRREVFLRAAEARKAGTFDRASVLSAIGDAAQIERTLFSDLKSEHVLQESPVVGPEELVERWELGQAQAVLLTAVRVVCEIRASSPGLVRAFFSKLKFHQLLFAAERTDDGWKITIDGPYSMFDAVTKYGLKLAFVLNALRPLEHWTLDADIRWGKAREPLTFHLESNAERRLVDDAVHLSDDVRELADAIKGDWKAKPSTAILDVPGLGVCIPDLELTRKGSKKSVFVEVLGYWSRDAVWKRVELAESGALKERVIFAVSSRLRVSAEVLDENAPASLYVYKGKMSPRSIIAHAELLAEATRNR
jgi:predicted nuclease of restriction endonuclease-like RecB superfamily